MKRGRAVSSAVLQLGKWSLAVVSAAAALGCQASLPSAADEARTERGAALALAGPVLVEDSGDWSTITGCSARCVYQYSFWADLAVRSDTYEKRVGVVWTKDAWKTHTTSAAHYVGGLGGGYEKWGIDVAVDTYVDAPPAVEYAVFVEMNGRTSWDAFNNYRLPGAVGRRHPVRLLSSGVETTPAGLGVLTGKVRVQNLAYAKQVSVRYSVDRWVTSGEAAATWTSGDEWSFRIEGLGGSELPEGVEFAVRYRVRGEEFWDSNGGRNFSHRLDPMLGPWLYDYRNSPTNGSVSGVLRYREGFLTDVPVERTEARLDDGAWGGAQLLFSTAALDDGLHALNYRALLKGGGEVQATIPFVVKNDLRPKATWSPRDFPRWAVAAAADPSGQLYVLNEDGAVLRYPSAGSDQAPQRVGAFPVADYGLTRVNQLAVDEVGGLYGYEASAEPKLHRLLPSGALDPDFAATHARSSGAVQGMGQTSTSLALGPDSIYVGSGEGPVVLRFTRRGELSAVINGLVLVGSQPGEGDIGGLVHDGTNLWVLLYGGASGARSRLIRLEDQPGTARVLESHFIQDSDALGREPWSPEGRRRLVRTSQGLFWLLEGGTGNRLLAIHPDGRIAGAWWGGPPSCYAYGDGLSDFDGSLCSAHLLFPWGTEVGTVGAWSTSDQVRLTRFAYQP